MSPFVRRSIVSLSVSALVIFSALPVVGAGKVYLVLGSDTAIWDGMDVSRYSPHYNLTLYTDPAQNAYKVMDPSFRAPLVDSYGTPMKLTWWMMAGDIFRYADNTNIPTPNIMTLYLMKKYHLPQIKQWGDELSLHYHTFAWTDYNQDGKYYWNQSHTFDECRDDFDVTMAQFLLEENVYPVSFRSGWHYMDNSWQRYLNELLPYSMHDDYPNKRLVTNEPIDNNFDWSLSSKVWVPFRPSAANYQLPGGSGGWNVRSKHIGSVTQAVMNDMFLEASKGTDQVACLWGHLPEPDFLDNLKKIDAFAHAAQAATPGVQFRYCTAVEAMQRWRNSIDSTAPLLTLSQEQTGGNVTFTIQSSEPIFQAQPFVAQKDLYERTTILACQKTGVNTWKAVSTVPASMLVKVAAAVTDTMGNLSTQALSYLPDDVYLDNLDSAYKEVRGAWATVATNPAWGTDSRQAVLADNDSVQCSWAYTVSHTGYYNFSIELPAVSNAALNTVFRIRVAGEVVSERRFAETIPSKTWTYLGTQMLSAGTPVTVEEVVNGKGQAGRIAASDVLKISALVRDRSISSKQSVIDFRDVSETDTGRVTLTLSNTGIFPLSVSGISAASPAILFPAGQSFVIPPMSSVNVPVRLFSLLKGAIADTLRIASNDPLIPELKIRVTGNITSYFTIADNDDPSSYTEIGSWSNSNASDCYGATSRYASLGPKARVVYKRTLLKSGIYDIQEILPNSSNSSTRARYVYKVNGTAMDSVFINQNTGSGAWIGLFRRTLPSGVPIEIEVSDASANTSANLVLRADAIRFMLKLETGVEGSAGAADAAAIPHSYALGQNYPNPFNPSTMIRYDIPGRAHVRLEVYNTVGQLMDVLEDGVKDAGVYHAQWRASVPSGLYFLRMRAESVEGPAAAAYTATRKMMLLR